MRVPSRVRRFASGLCLTVVALPAVELPITAVTIAPDGALVERAGTLPAGDEAVTGLPAGLDPQALAVSVAGSDRPAWHLRVDQPPRVEIPAELAQEREAVLAALAAALAAVERAHERVRVAETALTPIAVALDRPLPPPSPADQAALASFVATNRERAFAEKAAAILARETHEARLVAIDARIDAARPLGEARARLDLPGAGGRVVRIAYHLRQVRWAPAYRLEVVAGQATLVSLAKLDLGHGERWDGVPLTFTTRAAGRDILLPELSVPQLGVADSIGAVSEPRVARLPDRDAATAGSEMGGEGVFMAIGAGGGTASMFGSRSGGGRKRALARFGGSKGGESAVDAGLRWLKSQQRGDGTWGSEPFTTESTALATLAHLGAGYDHRVPSKYRSQVKLALAALVARPPAQLDLAELTLATWALAEAYGMTHDPELKGAAQARLDALRARGLEAGEAAAWLHRGQAFAGPEILAWMTAADTSCTGAGLSGAGDVRQRMASLAPLILRHRDVDEARLAGAYVACFSGGKAPFLTQPEVQRLTARAETMLARGRLELIQLANTVCFQQGGETWSLWNGTVRDQLIAAQRPDGGWTLPHPAGEVVASAAAILALEVYYRYTPVGAGGALSALVPAEAPLADPAAAGHGWPVRWTAPALTLRPGSRSTIEIARISLAGAVAWRAIPVLEPTVWRRLLTRNPLAQPLPEGDCELVFAGVALGTTRLPFVPPGAAFTIALGSDDAVRVVRTATSTSDDAMRTRTLGLEVTLRLDAPADWGHTVEVIEPLPRPTGNEIELTLRNPPLSGKELAKRLDADPFVRVELTPAGATAPIAWTLRYPAALRPFLEFE